MEAYMEFQSNTIHNLHTEPDNIITRCLLVYLYVSLFPHNTTHNWGKYAGYCSAATDS